MTARRGEVLKSLLGGPKDFVIEVGAGHKPCHSADLIVDKYPFDNLHRTDNLVHAAPVIKADATKLPLPAKGCDVLFASHVLEHLREPDKLIEEARRCAHRVYFEFPSMTRELIYAWSFHEWLIEVEDQHLTFYRNDIPQLFRSFFHRNHDALLEIWSSQRFDELNNYVCCESDQLTYEFGKETAFEHALISSPTGAAKVNWAEIATVQYSWGELAKLAARQLVPERMFLWAKGIHRRRNNGGIKPLSQALVDRLACQICGASGLVLKSCEIVCHSCSARYGQQNAIFDFDI